MLRLVLLAVAAASAYGLRLNSRVIDTSMQAAELFLSTNQACHDEANSELHPIVKAIAEYFPSKGIQVWPMALTALSAIRFGGLSNTFKNGKVHTFDRDLDFILHFPNGPPSKEQAREAVHGFRAHLSQTLPLAVEQSVDDQNETPDGTLIHRDHDLMHYWVTVKKETDVSRFDKAMEEQHPGDRSQPTTDQTLQSTQIDFWVSHNGELYQYKSESQSETVLLAGVPFKYRMTDANTVLMLTRLACKHGASQLDYAMQASVHTQLCAEFKKDKMMAKTNMCTFAKPGRGIYDSSEVSRDEDGVFASCATELKQHGYKSLAQCFNGGGGGKASATKKKKK